MANRLCYIKPFALFLVALLLFSFIFNTLGTTVVKAVSNDELSELEAEKQLIHNQKIEASNKAASLREEKAEWVEQKAALDEQNRLAQEEILNSQEQIKIYNQMIAEKQSEAYAAQIAVNETLEIYKKRMRSMEENGQLSTYIGVVVEASDFSDMLTRVDMITEIMDHDKRIEQNYKDARDSALALKAEYEQMNLELEAKKVKLEEEIKQLEIEIDEADKMIAEIQEEIEEYLAIYNTALLREAAVQKSINTIIAQLKAAEEAAEAEEAAKQSPATPNENIESSGKTSVVPDSSKTEESSTEEFAAPDTSTATGSYIWPLPSSQLVTSLFGNRIHPVFETTKFHKGIDINASVGASILAADGGTVITTGNDPAGYGIHVVIYHSDGRSTLYAHMSSSAVSLGQTVTQGQVIGYAGSSGMSTGPHLHFEIAIDGALQNPLNYFSDYTIWDQA